MAHGKVICESVNLHPTNTHSTVFSVGQRRRRRPAAATMSLLFIFILVILINISCVDCLYQHQHSYHSDSSKNLVNLEAKVGSHVVFNCRVDFPYDYDIPYIIHWSKDAKKIFTWYEGTTTTNDLYSGRLSLLKDNQDYGKASVNLTAIRESDQGRYHCQIMFPNRTPSIRNNGTFYHLVVEGGSLIKIPPINQTIMEGQTAFFHCTMKFPETSTIIWSKDGVALHDIQEIYRRSYFGPDGSLSIDPTMMSDLGHYECSVRNNDGEVQTSSAYLNIQYKAKVIYSPPEVYLPYGHPAVLDCHFRSNPPLKNLRWEKDGLLFDSYNVPGVFYKVNGSLFFSKVDETHTGSYTCTPYNELGTDGPSPIIHVIVLRPPIFTQRPKQIYIHKLGEDVHFTCEAADRDGHHHPTVSWSRKDGTPLPADRYIVEGGNLTLLQIEESDRGIFECAATNEAATVTADTELMIENIAPRPPSNLTAVNATLHSITIRWQPGYLRPDLEYIVLYRVAEAAEWRTMKSTSKDMELTINNLLPGTEYEFMVLSQDRFGDGMFSKPHKFYTNSPEEDSEQETVDEQLTSEELEEKQISDYVNSHQAPQTVSIGPPRNFFIMERKDGYILTWDPPEIGLDQLRIYIIRWWLEEDTKLYGSAETIETFYLIRHLREDSTYRVQVATLSITDDQSGSDVLEIKVPAHRKMRAITIGTTVVIIFIIAIVFVFYYLKRRFCRPHTEISSEKMDCGDD